MKPGEFCTLGEQAYGAGWQTKLARAVPVNPRTVRRWVAGKCRIPSDVADDLRALAKWKERSTRDRDTNHE
jgi:hypothetical protein